jgi:hypothetical protein
MIKNKLYTLLQTFPKQDLGQLRKFLESPFFNENPDLVRLFNLFEDHFQSGQTISGDSESQKKQIWKRLFGKRPYQDIVLRRLFSDLTQLSLEYLSYRQIQKDPLYQSRHTLTAINEAVLHKHFEGVVRQSQQQAEKLGLRNAYYHLHTFQIALQQHQHIEAFRKKPSSLEHLETADYHLDCFYFTQKLKNYCDILGYRKTIATEGNIRMLPSFLEYLNEEDYISEPSVKAYYLTALMLLHPEEESYFRQLKKVLDEESQFFTKEELLNLFIHLINYIIDTKINVGRSEYFEELFSIYQTALAKEFIIDEGVLDPHHYKNIITVGLFVKAFDWVEQFIKDYTPILPKGDQENALTYNLAKVYFAKKQYQKVIELLQRVEYQNLNYSLGAKLMLLKTYYELNEFLALDSLTDSFRIYLRRNKLISREVKQQYLNVLRFVKRLSNIAPFDTKSIEKIRMQINTCKALADKNWILEKVGELDRQVDR